MKNLLVVLMFFAAIAVNAFTVKAEDDPSAGTIMMIEEKPSFPGGEAAMYKWIKENICYPEDLEANVQGRVIVEFVVEIDGSLSNVRVVRSRHPFLDNEAIRLVKAMPAWTPGKRHGEPVKTSYILPITFNR